MGQSAGLQVAGGELNRLRSEIADLRSYIDGLPEALRDGPYGAPNKARLDGLEGELATVELVATAQSTRLPVLDLRVRSEATRGHRLRASVVGNLLQSFQGLYSALGQAASGKPTTRGIIPNDVLEHTLDVVAFAAGSFIARLALESPPQTTIPTSNLGLLAFDELERLVAAGDDHHELSGRFHALKGRVVSSYGKLLQLLVDDGADLDINLARPNEASVRHLEVKAESAAKALPVIKSVKEPEAGDTISQPVILNAANRRTGTFEIDLGEDGILTGKVRQVQLLEGVTIGKRYVFTLVEQITTNPLTDEVESSWRMDDVDDDE